MRAALDAYRDLRATHEHVAICGMSMGGALALWIASEEPDVRAVVGIAPYLHLSKPMAALLVLGPVAALGGRYLSGVAGRSVHDPEAARAIIAYRKSTPRLLGQLAKVTRAAFDVLPAVRQPVLVIQSREDNRIPAASAERAFARIGSSDKTLDWVAGTGHVLTVDYGHAEMERRIIDWLGRRLA
jgi:carboxylesterase